jgi:hypothetical protein
VNRLVVLAFVDMCGAEQNPMLGMRDRQHYGKNPQPTKDTTGVLSKHAIPPRLDIPQSRLARS